MGVIVDSRLWIVREQKLIMLVIFLKKILNIADFTFSFFFSYG